jgi:hypothetical protein
VDVHREGFLRSRVRGERGVVGDGHGADDGPSEAVVVVDAGARSSRWKGSKRRWTCSGGITGPVFAMETMALSPSTRVEISTRPPGTAERACADRVQDLRNVGRSGGPGKRLGDLDRVDPVHRVRGERVVADRPFAEEGD